MGREKNKTIQKKLLLFGLVLFLLQASVMGCTAIFFGGQIMYLLPAAEVVFAEDYKLVGQKATINWADMLIYDTVRYDNDLDKADPRETIFDFLVIEFERRERQTEHTLDDEGNIVDVDHYWVLAEKGVLYGKETLLHKLRDWRFNTRGFEFDEIIDTYRGLHNGEEYIIRFSGKDIEDLMGSFTEEQVEWANLLISGNFVFEMYGDVFDLPTNIPVAGEVKFAWPTPTLKNISSDYGWRTHPVTNVRGFHYGIDITGPNALGQPIISVADGVVYQVNYSNSTYGYNVRIKHIDEAGYEWETRYAHMSQINVDVGSYLKQGDVIGAVGNTGRSTGPHLHFELRFSGQLVNPYYYIGN